MSRVLHELRFQLPVRQRRFDAAPNVWLPILPMHAVLQRRSQVAGELSRVLVLRIDLVADFCRQCERIAIANAGVVELRQPYFAAEESDGHAERRAELRGIWRRRIVLVGQRFPESWNRS